MSNPRAQDDGSLLYPMRGNPPPVLDGYYRDPGDPFILRPKMVDCIFRSVIEINSNCASCQGKPVRTTFACSQGLKVTPQNCRNCKLRKE